MGNLILSNDFVDLGTITSITEEAAYPDDNVEEYWHLKRRFRATGVPKSDTDFLLKFDFGAAKSVVAVMLNDINFNVARVRMHTADLNNNWAAADFDTADVNVSYDERVNRFKIYIPVVADKRWMVVQVPAAATAVGDYTAKWEVGSVVVLDSATTLAQNAAYGYERAARKAYEDMLLPHGGGERVSLGDNLVWHGRVAFDARAKAANEGELWTINRYNIGNPLILYENDSDTSKVYLCLRDDDYAGTVIAEDIVVGNVMKFRELV